MLKIVFEVDKLGFIVESYVAKVDEDGTILDEDKKGFISTDLPNPQILLKPRWDGSRWVDGVSDEERLAREEIERAERLKPSPQELSDADLNIKIISLLFEMGVI